MKKRFSEIVNENIIIRNVTNKEQCFKTKDKPEGVILPASQTHTIFVSDLKTALNNDPFLYGIDNEGTYATLYIEDGDVREMMGFDEYEYKEGKKGKQIKKQKPLSESNIVTDILVKTQKDFNSVCDNFSMLSDGNKIMIAKIIEDKADKIDSISNKRMKQLQESIKIV